MYTNRQIIELLIKRAGVENPNQLAAYLTDKYGVNVTRQQIGQFQNSAGTTLPHMLLREALDVSVYPAVIPATPGTA